MQPSLRSTRSQLVLSQRFVSQHDSRRLRITDDFFQAASALVKAKPTYVAVGDISALPFADELGL